MLTFVIAMLQIARTYEQLGRLMGRAVSGSFFTFYSSKSLLQAENDEACFVEPLKEYVMLSQSVRVRLVNLSIYPGSCMTF